MELLTVGKISGTHHLKGAVKVVSNIENIEILLNNRIVVEVGENNQRIFTVKSASHLVGNKCVLEFEEITNKTEAGNLKNGFIKVRREILGVGEDEYLLNDLLNMKAIDIDTEEELGTVVDIFETAAHDILVIESAKCEVMVPDIDEFVKKIDFDKRVIYIHLIEGMKEEKGKNINKMMEWTRSNMKINILTLFPEMFSGFKSESIIGKALEKNLLEINIVNIRDFCYDKHKQADDMPFGGGAGMVIKPEPLFRALETVKGKVIYTTPQGVKFNQKLAIELAQEEEITIIAGHYEGIDERVVESKVDLEVSIGDFVLTGGELPAMMMADCIARLVPGVIKKESYENDSFFNGLLDYPHYTRPAEYEGMKVPEVLLSGHHKNIETWRLKESLKRTYLRRRDLLVGRELSKKEKKLLAEIKRELGKEKNDI